MQGILGRRDIYLYGILLRIRWKFVLWKVHGNLGSYINSKPKLKLQDEVTFGDHPINLRQRTRKAVRP